MRQQFRQRRGHLARSRGCNHGILRFRGGREGGRAGQWNVDAVAGGGPVSHAEENGAAGEAGRGIGQGSAKFTGVGRDAQAADRLVELLRLLSPRVFARALEEDFELGGNFS